MSVLFTLESNQYIKDLLDVLINKQYFSYSNDAKEYIDKLLFHCYNYIPILPGKKAPERFKRYGRDLRYITYRPNRQTTWYIFYQQRNDVFVVTYITNNHVNAHHIRGLR
jgi:hypothetical protein